MNKENFETKGKLLLIIGRSGCDKKKLQTELITKYGFRKAIPYSTKPIKAGIVADYNFVKESGFLKMAKERQFITSKSYDSMVGNQIKTIKHGNAKTSIDLSNGNYVIVVTIKELIRFYSYYDSEDIISINLESEYYTRCGRMMDSGMEVLDIVKLEDFEEDKFKGAKGYTDRTFLNDGKFNELLDKVLAYLKNRNALI